MAAWLHVEHRGGGCAADNIRLIVAKIPDTSLSTSGLQGCSRIYRNIISRHLIASNGALLGPVGQDGWPFHLRSYLMRRRKRPIHNKI